MTRKEARASLRAKQNPEILKKGWKYYIVEKIEHHPMDQEPWIAGTGVP